MKRFWIGSALAMIAIVTLGLVLNQINTIKTCKDYLVSIGDFYVTYCDYKEKYLAENDTSTEYAQSLKKYANECANHVLYLIRYMEERNEPELILKCIPKLSLSQMKNLEAAFDYYAENIDFVNEAYGTPEPRQ